MGTTDVSYIMKYVPGDGVTVDHILERVKELYIGAMGDLDKSTDPLDYEYYFGESNAYSWIANLIAYPPAFPDATPAVKTALPLLKVRNLPLVVGVALIIRNGITR